VIATVSKSELKYLQPINWLGLHRQYLNEGEMEIIAALLRSVCAESIMEIGCRDGRTARVLLHNVPSLHRYIGIDVLSSHIPTLDHQRAEMHPTPGYLAASDPRFDLIIHPHGSLDVKIGDFERVDACFIDGDHSQEVVEKDSVLALALVRNGGMIIWHDYNDANTVFVKPAIDGLCKRGWKIAHVEGTWLCFMYVEPDPN